VIVASRVGGTSQSSVGLGVIPTSPPAAVVAVGKETSVTAGAGVAVGVPGNISDQLHAKVASASVAMIQNNVETFFEFIIDPFYARGISQKRKKILVCLLW
jgi:hypothetical protein